MHLFLRYSFIGALLITTIGCGSIGGVVPVGGFDLKEHVIVHRGNIKVGPGNTLTGINDALMCDGNKIEIDLRHNSEGTIFLFHDGRLRASNSIAPLGMIGNSPETLSDENLHLLCPHGREGDCPLLFTRLLEKTQMRKVVFFLDIKNMNSEFLREIIGTLRQYDAVNKVVIQCQSIAALRMMRKEFPSIKVLARIFHPQELDLIKEYKPEFVQLDPELLRPAYVLSIHAQGEKIVTKAIDTPLDNSRSWMELLEAGADLILSDRFIDELCQ